MELNREDLIKGMLVKVVFYHSQMPESWFSREIGIVYSINKRKKQIKVRVITQDFSDSVDIIKFFIHIKKQRIVANNALDHYDRFSHLEPLSEVEWKLFIQSFKDYHKKEVKKLDQLGKYKDFINTIDKKYSRSTPK